MSQIKAIRELLGVTQSELAAGIECTQGNVVHLERGQVLLPENAKKLIAFALRRGVRLSMDQVYGLKPLPHKAHAA